MSCLYLTSFPSALSFVRWTIGRLSSRIIILLRSQTSLVQFLLPVFLPVLLLSLLLSVGSHRQFCSPSGSVPHQIRRFLLCSVYSAGIVQSNWWWYRRLNVTGRDSAFYCSTSLLATELLFLLRIISIISRVPPQW